jgi:hypothetical protein
VAFDVGRRRGDAQPFGRLDAEHAKRLVAERAQIDRDAIRLRRSRGGRTRRRAKLDRARLDAQRLDDPDADGNEQGVGAPADFDPFVLRPGFFGGVVTDREPDRFARRDGFDINLGDRASTAPLGRIDADRLAP